VSNTSQHDQSASKNYASPGDLLAEAQAKTKIIKNKAKSGRKDHFMSLRHNVKSRLRPLFHVLKPAEYYVLELIADETIDWKAEFRDIDLEAFALMAKLRMDVLKRVLKTLHEKGYITRAKSKRRGYIETFSLDSAYFGA